MGRPKGSGRNLVAVTWRVAPEVYGALQERAERQDRSLGEVAREVLWAALVESGHLEPVPAEIRGYEEGIRRGMAEVRTHMAELWDKKER